MCEGEKKGKKKIKEKKCGTCVEDKKRGKKKEKKRKKKKCGTFVEDKKKREKKEKEKGITIFSQYFYNKF